MILEIHFMKDIHRGCDFEWKFFLNLSLILGVIFGCGSYILSTPKKVPKYIILCAGMQDNTYSMLQPH